jgi:hypothetical protein
VNIIRISPSVEEPTEDIAYFIEVPAGGRVTVNGHTYIYDTEQNSNGTADEALPFFIGPLTRYTVIELLSQPVFFFRTRDDLDYTNSKGIVSGAKARPTADELSRRNANGNVSADAVEVTWTPIPDVPDEDPQSDPKSPALGSDRSSGDLASKGPGDGEEPPEALEYSDNWTDNGEPIEDSCDYLRRNLLNAKRQQYNELIPRVLASINNRQPRLGGFSFHYDSHIRRPGRILITSIEHEQQKVTLVVQNEEDQLVSIRILDPMAWRSNRTGRNLLLQHARELLVTSQWWRNNFGSQEEMQSYLPDTAQWVPCAQHTSLGQASTYTVLNAWALGMGLEPDPKFRPVVHGGESFFTRAQWLFDLALQDRLY